jgi:hypothetical protein
VRHYLLIAALVALAGCGRTTTTNPPIQVFPDMKQQPKLETQHSSDFFPDRRATRRPVPGTVAVGQLKEDEGFYTGIQNGMYVGRNPLGITEEVLVRGQERFNIYCAPCHDRAGTGRGIVSQRGVWPALSVHDDRIKNMVDGELFDVITHGRRTMPGYRFQISERDRWAIVAYVRALQRATSGTVEDVPADLRGELR